jgi:8-oxo-dGTP diphosphatase
MVIEKSRKIECMDINRNRYQISVDQLEWRPSAYAVVIKDSKILLVKDGGLYHLPGGGIDIGEEPGDAAIREVKEETGLKVVNPQLIGSNSSFFTWIDLLNNNEAHHFHVLMFYYKCDFSNGVVSNAFQDVYEKAADLKIEWLSLKSLDSITIGTTIDWRPIVKQVINTK